MPDLLSSPAGGNQFIVIDVGARWGAAESWRSLGPDLRVIGFDPDPDECSRLNEAALADGDETSTYVPVALGPRRETVDLHVAIQPACSSIYPPRPELVTGVPALAEMAVERTVRVDLEPLDEWCAEHGVDHVDVLKMDTQGSELGVLQGALGALSTCVLVECEVEFNPLYEGQPLFADVDSFLRDRGFVLWRLDNLAHYTDGDVMPRLDETLTVHTDGRPTRARLGGGQLFWGDAYWVRADLLWPPESLETSKAQRAAQVAGAAGLSDLAVRIWPDCAPALLAEARRARRKRRRATRQGPQASAPKPGAASASPLTRVVRVVRSAGARARRLSGRG